MAGTILSQEKSHSSQLRAAIFARVSTTNNGQDPVVQTREMKEYCPRRGWGVVDEYVDVGISGTKEKRPELDRLMGDAHRRRFDVVVVWRFDRFARSVSLCSFGRCPPASCWPTRWCTSTACTAHRSAGRWWRRRGAHWRTSPSARSFRSSTS